MSSGNPSRYWKNILILIFLLTLILTPRLIVGWLDLESARRYDTVGDYARAASAYVEAAQRLFWRADLWQEAGLAAFQAGDAEGTIANLTLAKEHRAITAEGWLALGDAYAHINDTSNAVNAWQMAGDVAPAYERLVKVHRAEGDFPMATQDLQRLVSLDPENASTHFELGLFLAAFRPEEALPELLRAAQLDHSLDSKVQSMRTELNTAMLSEDKAYRLVVAGRALAAQDQWDLAAEAFRGAVNLQLDYAEAWAWLGEAEQHLGQDGLPSLQRAMSLAPNSATIYALTGMYYQRHGESSQAVIAYKAAVNLEPQTAAWHVALGGAYESNRDLLSALKEYQLALELDPKNVPAWQAMALYSVVNGSDLKGNGFAAARKLIELSSEDWQSLDIAGQVTYALGNLREARDLFEKAIKQAPFEAAPHFHLALVLFDLKENDVAFAHLKLAIDLDPNGPVGWQASRLMEQYFP